MKATAIIAVSDKRETTGWGFREKTFDNIEIRENGKLYCPELVHWVESRKNRCSNYVMLKYAENGRTIARTFSI